MSKFDGLNNILNKLEFFGQHGNTTDNMQIIFQVDKMYANEEEVDRFSRTIMDKMRREKGLR